MTIRSGTDIDIGMDGSPERRQGNWNKQLKQYSYDFRKITESVQRPDYS